MPIPSSDDVGGYNYKKLGIIILNSKEPSKRSSFPNTYFLKKICSASFKKVVLMHEIICHYCSCLIHGNKIDYEHYDLLGKKIEYIFIERALYILNNQNFDKTLYEFTEKFFEINNIENCIKEELNIKE